jgi:protein-tyrosine phosphatase
MDNPSEARKESHWIRSTSFRYMGALYNAARGCIDFNFDTIMHKEGDAAVEQDDNGTILHINDGKQIPLLLGCIPRKKEHIDQVKKQCNLSHNATIDLHTFNRQYERDFTGESALINADDTINFFEYPTTDTRPPLMVDLVRVVHSLEKRTAPAYVHCWAGKGRSAVAVGAYLTHVCHKQGIKNVTPGHIEEYLHTKRPQVNLSSAQKKALQHFTTALKEAGNLEQLYASHEDEIQKREQHLHKPPSFERGPGFWSTPKDEANKTFFSALTDPKSQRENWYKVTPYVAEFWCTVSNIGFICVGLQQNSPELVCAGIASAVSHTIPKQWLLGVDKLGVALVLSKVIREYGTIVNNPWLLAPLGIACLINVTDAYLARNHAQTWPHVVWHLSSALFANEFLKQIHS